MNIGQVGLLGTLLITAFRGPYVEQIGTFEAYANRLETAIQRAARLVGEFNLLDTVDILGSSKNRFYYLKGRDALTDNLKIFARSIRGCSSFLPVTSVYKREVVHEVVRFIGEQWQGIFQAIDDLADHQHNPKIAPVIRMDIRLSAQNFIELRAQLAMVHAKTAYERAFKGLIDTYLLHLSEIAAILAERTGSQEP